jgi:hypothetical protein
MQQMPPTLQTTEAYMPNEDAYMIWVFAYVHCSEAYTLNEECVYA